MRQRQNDFNKKFAWEFCEDLTLAELAERKFWRDTVNYLYPGLLKSGTPAEKKTFFSKCVNFIRGGL
ncbi:MAG: hypothetical protein AB1349_07970 [Elusimicrobiota bacterium]